MTKTEAAELVALRKEVAKLARAVASITPAPAPVKHHHIADAPKPRPADATYVYPHGASIEARAHAVGIEL